MRAAQVARLQEPGSGSSTRSSNLEKLAELYLSGGDVTIGDLVAKGAVRKNEKVKVLGNGDIAVEAERPGRQGLRAPPSRRSSPAGGSAQGGV